MVLFEDGVQRTHGRFCTGVDQQQQQDGNYITHRHKLTRSVGPLLTRNKSRHYYITAQAMPLRWARLIANICDVFRIVLVIDECMTGMLVCVTSVNVALYITDVAWACV